MYVCMWLSILFGLFFGYLNINFYDKNYGQFRGLNLKIQCKQKRFENNFLLWSLIIPVRNGIIFHSYG